MWPRTENLDRNLNRSLTSEIIIKKDKLFVFFVLEPGINKEKIDIKHEMAINSMSKISKKKASAEINNITQQRINQVIGQGGKEAERILPKILRGSIEDLYQTPFRLLGKFGKQQVNKLKNKILR